MRRKLKKFYRNIRRAPSTEEVERTLVSNRPVIGRNRDKHGRSAVGRRCGFPSVRGIDRRREVRPRFGRSRYRRQQHATARREPDHADPIGMVAKFPCMLTGQSHGLLAVSAA